MCMKTKESATKCTAICLAFWPKTHSFAIIEDNRVDLLAENAPMADDLGIRQPFARQPASAASSAHAILLNRLRVQLHAQAGRL
jgi:hypothetical protein